MSFITTALLTSPLLSAVGGKGLAEHFRDIVVGIGDALQHLFQHGGDARGRFPQPFAFGILADSFEQTFYMKFNGFGIHGYTPLFSGDQMNLCSCSCRRVLIISLSIINRTISAGLILPYTGLRYTWQRLSS